MKNRKELVGVVLAKERAASDKSIAEAIQGTELSEQFVHDVESCRYENLPHNVYTVHGIRQYARALGIDEDAIVGQYVEERGGMTHISPLRRSRQRLSPVVTSSLAFRSMLAAIAVVVIGYIVYQIAVAAGQPPLNVVFPRENQTVYTNEIELVGSTEPGNTVTIDGRRIIVSDDGSFRHVLALPEGRHSINVAAENDFGRTSHLTRHFIIEQHLD